MKYVTTTLESLVEKLYFDLGISEPNHSIEDIASGLDIDLHFFPKPPFSMRGGIILDPRLTKEEQKEIFAHELAHVLYHVGIQLIMPEPFRQLQEYQARNFSFHFCIPTFMLKKLTLPDNRYQAAAMISETFGVSTSFANERLMRYENQLAGARYHDRLLKYSENKTNQYYFEQQGILQYG